MTKYRAVLLVPSVVEFENEGTMEQVTEQVKRIAGGLGKAASMHPLRKIPEPYVPLVAECVVVDGVPKP